MPNKLRQHDPFADARQLISHARDQIGEAERLIAVFLDKQRGTFMVKVDPKTGQDVYSMRITGPSLSSKISKVTIDAAGNLRDALDRAVYGAAVAINGGAPKHTGFPFARDAAKVQKALNGKRLSGNPSEIRALLASFDPHEGGNDLLWALSQVGNPITRRFIVPVGWTTFSGAVVGQSTFRYNRGRASSNEIVYMRMATGSRDDHQVPAKMGVAFEGIKAIAGKDVVGTLTGMAYQVERIVGVIEAETTKLTRRALKDRLGFQK